MAKVHTTISVDSNLLEEAKNSYVNISQETEKALRLKLHPTKKDMPLNNLSVHCSLCKKEIEEGYLCRERQLVLCLDCGLNFNMNHCPHDKYGQHEHIRWPGFENQNAEVKKEVVNAYSNQNLSA